MRIDGAMRPPGIVSGAKMFSLIFENEKLFVIHTGPGLASQQLYSSALNGKRLSRGLINNIAVGMVAKRTINKVMRGQERIDNGDINELVKEKHSVLIPKSNINNVKLTTRYHDIRLEIMTTDKKYKFDCPLFEKENVEELCSLLKN